MPTIRQPYTAPAGGTVFPLQGQQYEFLPFSAALEFAVLAAAAGLEVTIYSGSDLLQQRGPATVKTTPPLYPDDFLLTDAARASERLSIEVSNPTGAPIAGEVVVKITPI
jgi:hypothetical protein